MKKTIKLRDLTAEQWDNWVDNNCNLKVDCENCPIYRVDCDLSQNDNCWVNHKDIYSDKFLDQEIEIEIENEELLSEEDKEYLKPILEMLKNNKIIQISKRVDSFLGKQVAYIRVLFYSSIEEYGQEKIDTQLFLSEVRFKKLEANRYYTLEELGL